MLHALPAPATKLKQKHLCQTDFDALHNGGHLPNRMWPLHPSYLAHLRKMFGIGSAKIEVAIYHPPTDSNLSCLDKIVLDWLKQNGFTVIKDDKSTALIPIKNSLLADLQHQICEGKSKFEPAACDKN